MGYLDNAGLAYFFGKIKGSLMSTAEKSKLNGIATGATKNSVTQTNVTLAVSGWNNNKQTVTVSGVTTSNLVIAQANDSKYGIKVTTQASNSLAFTCEKTPTEAVRVNIAIIS